MVAKVLKLAVVPAALGLASFRVYAKTEDKADRHISPRELSIYSAKPQALQYVEEKPGRLQTGFGLIREGLQSSIGAVQYTCTSVKSSIVSSYQAAQDTYYFLRDPPPGFLPRVGVITVSGLAGLILARKGSRIKRVGISLALASVGAAVCYPVHTVRVVKVTGKKVYAASSLVASTFSSKPKDKGAVEIEVVPQPDEVTENVLSVPEGESVLEAASVAPVSEDSPPIDVGPAVDNAQGEVVSLVEGSPGLALTPVSDVASEDVSPPEVVEPNPQEETTTAVEETTPPSLAVEETTPPSLAVEETTPPSLAVEETTPPSLAVEETTPPSLAVEETTPPPAEGITPCPSVKEKPRFVPDPSLVDHGQANPEDADLYSTRG